jgi:hypothetical protein
MSVSEALLRSPTHRCALQQLKEQPTYGSLLTWQIGPSGDNVWTHLGKTAIRKAYAPIGKSYWPTDGFSYSCFYHSQYEEKCLLESPRVCALGGKTNVLKLFAPQQVLVLYGR